MLYSQALTGGHRAAPSSSSSPSATKAHPDTTTTSTPTETTKQDHRKHTKATRGTSPNSRPHHSPRTQHQNNPHQPTTNPDHKPNTPNTTSQETVYVLTLKTTPSLTDPVTSLRRTHFPRNRDRGNLPAHLTMFHALPGSEMGQITSALDELCCGAGTPQQQQQQQRPLRLATGAPFRMRRGVGINVTSADADDDEGGATAAVATIQNLHAELQRRWWGFLSAQDRQPWRPHWTVQNKSADQEAVDKAMNDVRDRFRGAEGMATGCALWRYDKGGRWAFERGFDFGGGE